MRCSLRVSSLFLPFVVVLAGCGKGSFNNSVAVDGVLCYPLMAKNTTLDPGKVNDVYMAEVLWNVGEGLVAYDEKNELVPCLAEKWDLEDGGKTYVFHLRPGVKFSNGRALTAQDFKWSWERNLSPKLASPSAVNYLGSIEGVSEFVAGNATEIKGVQVVDDATLKVTLDQPRPYYLGNFTVSPSYPIAKEAAGDGEATKVEQVVATGPFKLEKLLPDQELTLVPNPNYWGSKPLVTKIRRPIVTDVTTRLSKFKSGEFDYIELGSRDADTLKPEEAKQFNLKFYPQPSLSFLVLGEKAFPLFKDARVRRAFAMAFDRTHMVKDLLKIHAEAKGLVPHGVPGYQENYAGLPYDPVAAKRELAAAGFPDGKGFPSVELDFTAVSPENRIIAEAFATDLKKNLNVTIQPRLLEWGAYLDRQDHGKVQIGSVGWTADYLDAQNFLSMQIASTGSQNKEGFKDAEVDALLAEADRSSDQKLRIENYQKAERRVIEIAARIPIYMRRLPVLTSNRVKGLRMNALGLMPNTTAEVVTKK